MKILKAKADEIDFKYDSQTIVHITKEGVKVSDIVAQTALDRLAVTVEDCPADEIEPESETKVEPVAPTIEATVEPTPDPEQAPLPANE